MTENQFDPAKPCQQRCGRPATILATDSINNIFPLVVATQNANGHWSINLYTIEGCFGTTKSQFDLVNIPESVNIK